LLYYRVMIYLVFGFILFETLLALVTQFFRIFYFWVIFSANVSAVLIATFFIARNWKNRINFRPDWILIFVAVISVLYLYQVHYNYTGKINLATDRTVGYHDVKNMVYPYPYYSDEWDAVSLMKYSINSHVLPFKNPLDNSLYINFAAPFFSFLSGIALLLRVDPLLSFNYLSIFINTLIIILGYVFLRFNKMPKAISGITALFLLYIPSAANLPGTWHLIPIHMGIVFSLIGFCFMSLSEIKLAAMSAVAVLMFYPPLILFYAPALLIFLFSKSSFININAKRSIAFLAAGLFLAGLAVLAVSPQIKGAIFLRLFYPSFSGSYIPQYNFYDIIPWASILFFIFTAKTIFKNYKWLFSQIVLGTIFWILYSFATYRIIIDYERIVFFTSIIVVLASGFGMKILFDYIDSKKLIKYPASNFIIAGFIIFFILFIPFYTSQNNWQKFVLINPVNGAKAYAKAPANNYLVSDDIELFKDIRQQKFLSIPWKGLVIGVATNNYPAVAKEGIMSVGNSKIIDQFLQADCAGKLNMAKNQKLDYIYLYEFNCQGFEKIGTSQEGFVLFKVL